MGAINKSYSLLVQLTKTSSSSQWHEMLANFNYTLATLDLHPLNISSDTCPVSWLLQLPIANRIHQMIVDASANDRQLRPHTLLPVMSGRVTFASLESSYPTDGRIVVKLINGVKKFSTGDKVILSHITNNSQPLATFIASSVNIDRYTLDVAFDLISIAQQLSDSDRYYLSYISNGKLIANSDSFLIVRPQPHDLVEFEASLSESDDEFIVIKSEKALFQDRIQHLAYENGMLEFQNRALIQKIQSLEEELARFKSKSRRNHSLK